MDNNNANLFDQWTVLNLSTISHEKYHFANCKFQSMFVTEAGSVGLVPRIGTHFLILILNESTFQAKVGMQ